MSEILDIARRYVEGGVAVVPIRADGTKSPACATWKPYQERLPIDDELRSWFGNCVVLGLAGVGGRVSKNLEVIDVDDRTLIAPFIEAVELASPGLMEKICQHETPRPGAQFAFRCSEIETPGNTKLAQTEPRPVFNEDTGEPEINQKTGRQRVAPKTLIETRGEGGYFLLPGSPAECHKTGRLYLHVEGPAIHELRDISAADRDVLFRVARQFNLYVDDEDERDAQGRGAKRRDDLGVNRDAAGSDRDSRGLRPGDDFNVRASWEQILEPYDWRQEKTTGGLTHWTRPGKETGTSATTGAVSKAGNELLCVFSSNAHPFEGAAGGKPCSSYSKFAAYTLLNHGGNYEEATKALAAEGYGDQSVPSRSGSGGDSLSLFFSDARTEHANARRLIRAHGSDLLYTALWDKWLIYDEKRWAIDQTRKIDALMKSVAARIWDEVAEINKKDVDEKLKQAVVNFAKSSNSAAGIRNAVSLARSEFGIPILPEMLDNSPLKLNLLNGTLDLRTGELHQHARQDLLTKLAPVEYDPNAKCPRWLLFLDRVMAGNAGLIEFLKRSVGMSLTGLVRDHVLLVCYGTGANGKSVFLNTIMELMGPDYSIKAATDLLMSKGKGESHPTERADLFGKRFVAAIEVEDGKRLAEALVKELTGGDRIRARRMREDFWEFAPQHHLWLAVNHKPGVRGNDSGIWRRLKLIPFAVTVPEAEQDKQLTEKLKSELPGILAWAVEGCIAWQRDGLGEPDEVKAATAEYRSEVDVIGQFIAEQCLTGNPSYRVRAMQLYRAYEQWAEAGNEHVATSTKFGLVIAERGFEKRMNNGTWYVGIAVRSDEERKG